MLDIAVLGPVEVRHDGQLVRVPTGRTTEVLVRLGEEGRRLGIVSAKRRSTVELAFARVPLGHLFDVIVGGDETERQKPAPDPLLLALDRLDAKASDAAYVGDSPYDMQAARAAGVYAVGVSWGGIHDGALLGREIVVFHGLLAGLRFS